MDTTNDDIDAGSEEENNVNVPLDTDINTDTSSGLQQIEDCNDDLPLPMGMAEVISNRAEPPKQVKLSK